MTHKHKHEHENQAGSEAPNGQPASPASGAAAGPGAATGDGAPDANTSPAPDVGSLQPQKDDVISFKDWMKTQAERDDLLRRLQHVSADYLNYQKRIQKEVRHDVEKALEAGTANHPTDDPLLAGLRLIQQKALAALGPFGLAPIECLGKPFDPDRHSAVVQEATSDHPPNTVVREFRKGYTVQGRMIRPSMVAVSVAPKPV
jgi:molecular chaperone GrpE